MKPLVEKLPLSENTSFVARTYRTPHFEVPWHQHIEYELILFTEGEGVAFAGNHIGEFKTGDIFFLGSNLPHCFQKAEKEMITSAVVVQFREDFWGKEFLALPECKSIRDLLAESLQGLKLSARARTELAPMIRRLEHLRGIARIIALCECLQRISVDDYRKVSTQEVKQYNNRHKERIDAIFQFTINNFQDAISLDSVAGHVGMSVPAFCSYFKKSTKKTYVEFLNELRIGHACKLLIDTQRPVLDICYESGYNTLANFNKQFQRMKKMTPSVYRRRFSAGEAIPWEGGNRIMN
jgi:AraC-like DNA-binding protein